MEINKLTFSSVLFPEVLRHIPEPPKTLFVLCSDFAALLARPFLAVVGSRKATVYGKQTTTQLAAAAAKEGIVIVSGLAYGIDSIAHRAALDVHGQTVAVLPAGLDTVYPAAHEQLAQQILAQGGALISEYPPGVIPYPGNFIARNRLISGLSRATLITEAAQKSGSLHTARFALEQGRDVLAVPGNITSPLSAGTNTLIHSGATPIIDEQTLLFALGIVKPKPSRARKGVLAVPEQCILDLLGEGTADGGELLRRSQLGIAAFNQTLTMLEIQGLIRPLGNNRWGQA